MRRRRYCLLPSLEGGLWPDLEQRLVVAEVCGALLQKLAKPQRTVQKDRVVEGGRLAEPVLLVRTDPQRVVVQGRVEALPLPELRAAAEAVASRATGTTSELFVNDRASPGRKYATSDVNTISARS